MPNQKFKCPECGGLIEYLNYNAQYTETTYGTSNGSYDLIDQCHNNGDQSCDGSDDFEETDFEYECPLCNCCIDDPDDLEEVEEDEIEEIETQVKRTKLEDQIIFNKSSILMRNERNYNMLGITNCPKCKTIILCNDERREALTCPKCSHELYAQTSD